MTTEEIKSTAKESSWVPYIHWHQWSVWSDPVETFTGHKQQWRVCMQCNKAQFRTLMWDKQSSLQSVLVAIRDLRARVTKDTE